jgi:hypothetical protein
MGAKSPSAVAAAARRYEAATRARFPALLGAILAEVNGIDVEETEDGEVDMVEEAALEGLSNGLLAAVALDLTETADGFSGLLFGVADGTPLILCPQGVVFAGKGASVLVAEDLAAFTIDWCRLGLSVDAVVRAQVG